MIYQLILQGDIEGLKDRCWTFVPPAVLGRNPSVPICIEHPSISRQHCQFALNHDGTLVVRDLNSLNGIYVDDNRVKQAALLRLQVIQIGALRLQVEMLTDDEEPVAPRRQASGNLNETQPMKTVLGESDL